MSPPRSHGQAILSRGTRSTRPRLRRRDGDDAVRQGHLPQSLVRRAEPHAARSRRRGAPDLRARAAPTSSRPTRSAPTGSSWSHFGLADQAHAINVQGARIARTRGARSGLGRRRDRSARHPHRAVGQDRRRRSGGRTSPSRRARSSRAASTSSCSRRSATSTRSAPRSARVRSVCDLPIVAQMTTEEDGNTRDGAPPEAFVPELERCGADVVGLNCSVGPAAMLETIERLARVATVKLAAQPNAGQPREIEGRNIYLCSPEYMASYARRFIASGVRLVGGCCGTTPEHIRQIKQAVAELAAQGPSRRRERAGQTRGQRCRRPRRRQAPAIVGRSEKSRMGNALARGTLRGQRRAGAAARLPRRSARRAGAAAAHPRRRSRQHSGRPAGDRPHERARRGGHGPAGRQSKRSSTTPAAIAT